MLFQQLVDDDLGCASYLIGDEAAGEAVVIDPAYAIEPYLAAAERAGVRIVRVLETHNHADHVSGHGRLALEHDVPVSIHVLAEAEYEHEPLEDGAEVTVGSLTVKVMHTPGHRPEHCCFLVAGHLLTGDSLLIGDAARPDLAVEAREGAEDLFASLRRLTELPDETEVDPGHTGGSLCGAGLRGDKTSTIGMERLSNEALKIGDLQEFVAHSAAISAPRPPTVERVVALNRGPFLAAQPPLEQLDAPQGQLLDVRAADAHAAGHAHGAVNVPLDGSSVGTKAAFVLDHDEPITIHASFDGRSGRGRPAPERGRPARASPATCSSSRRRSKSSRSAWTSSRRCSRTTRPRCSTCARRTSATRATSRAAGTSPTGSCARSGTSSTTAGRW